MKTPLLTLLCFYAANAYNQNLIINPSAEAGASVGWVIALEGAINSDCYGNSDWRIIEGNGFPTAQNGDYYFYCGCENTGNWNYGDLKGQLYQDIDVTGYAQDIDSEIAVFSFSGYLYTWSNGGGDDAGRITIEYKDISGNVLSIYDSGVQTSINTWTQITDSRLAPINTRTIRITLRSYIQQSASIDAYFDNLSLTTNAMLPVQLTSFSGKMLDSEQILLEWETASEINNQQFEIEESFNALHFNKIGQINGKGNSTEPQYYTYTRLNPSSKLNYYRLKQIDFDGNYHYSNIVSVAVNKTFNSLSIHPNPSNTRTITVNHTSSSNYVNISILNITGALVHYQKTKTSVGQNTITINLNHLEKGLYILNVIDSNNTSQGKFILN